MVEEFNESDAFGQLLSAAARVAEQHAEMPGADVAAMYIALANFVGAVYPDRLDYIDRVLSSCQQVGILHPGMQYVSFYALAQRLLVVFPHMWEDLSHKPSPRPVQTVCSNDPANSCAGVAAGNGGARRCACRAHGEADSGAADPAAEHL